MNGKPFIIGVVMLAVGLGAGYYLGTATLKERIMMGDTSTIMDKKQMDLYDALAKLWSDHVIWTRNYVIAAIAGTPDAPTALERLMKNQEDLGAAVVPYYGKEAGNTLTSLLKDHIKIAGDVVKAAKANDQEDFKALDATWHANARDIAEFLNSANPKNWPKEDMQAMMYDHLNLLTNEVTARLKKDWKGDIKAMDDSLTQILMMAHDMAAGLIKQFPAKF